MIPSGSIRRAVSISLGSSRRDHAVVADIGGVPVRLERVGTNGDLAKAARLFRELDGKVDALGLGGADLGFRIGERWYPLHSVFRAVRDVRRTPLVDGTKLKRAIERRAALFLEDRCGTLLDEKRVLLTSAVDRWELARSFAESGFECVFGDFMFSFGLPLPFRSLNAIARLGPLLFPAISRLPFSWIYPTGEHQAERKPRWGKWFRWARVVAGDCQYIRRTLPDRWEGGIVLTNTTTPEDVELFRRAGVRILATTSPVLEGRTFGANLMEAGLIAAAGAGRELDEGEIRDEVDRLGWTPVVRELN
ncbi:MAG: quinate 5-dehydrogenase [Candidatus Aminicenantes bacterium]|nr:quinate 5-dehydrogenase [Candidatus Aminicenantes bacterium]